MRNYTTQMDAARKGIVTPEIKLVAEKEHMDVDKLMTLVAEGKVAICANKNHTCLSAEGVGSMLRTKINVNLGVSRDCKDYDVEMQKVMSAVNLGAEAIMDLSSHGNTQPFRRKLTSECPVMIGTVPVYDSVIHYQRDLATLTAHDFIDVIRMHAEDGVDFVTLHCGITRKTIEQIKKHKRKIYFLIFVLPTLAAFLIGFVYPFFNGIYLSFCKFRTTSDAVFIGFGNYVKAFQNEGFLHSFWFTVLFVIVSVILINLIAFFVAYALTLGIRGSNVFRTVFFVPNLVGGIILGYIWQYIFNGILQYYGTNLALNANYGFWGLVILMCWQQAGYMMIIYIAGFQSVPHDLYEAAKIDGAGKRQLLTNVTLPMMMPSITICTFLTLTNSFKLFDQNLALTGGAPGIVSQGSGTMVYQTEMMALNIYNTFYANQNSRGVGQAEGVIFFVIVVIIALIQLYFTRRKEVQQ